MKRTTALLAAVLMGSTIASYPAFAQTNDNAMTSSDASTMSMADVSTKLETAKAADVQIASTADMANTDHTTGSSSTPPLNTTEQEQQSLQAAIMKNQDLSQKLQGMNVDVSSIAAAKLDAATGTITLYTK
ncbi:hypothetical protein [Pararhizobium mangrovi]|uniref:Uncharacterized protein n=1 Tax=Pararhizobium mangrovi TaxID=2590452 RepID=A0A506UF05_9HYPH|nr:hypothetical protein [Pararhizobium mangrovi]TPW30357.1 hypothetical protein FJU11_04935 [Pararhizobium mangrovi]